MATVGLIYLGNIAEADTDESDWDNENDGVFTGLYDSTVLRAVTVNVTEPQGDGIAYDDDQGQTASVVSYDVGAGPQDLVQDSVAVYNAVITLWDGSDFATQVNVVQLANGDTFLTENSGGVSLDNLSIQSIQIGSVIEDNTSGWFVSNSVENTNVVCFASGTSIDTPDGPRRVERIRVGDLVLTRDRGPQPVRWCGARHVLALGQNAPVNIPAGALGPGIPATDLRLSPQHRVLLRSRIVQRMTAQPEVLAHAKALCGTNGILRQAGLELIGYHHLMLDHHAVLSANGALAESFFPGPQAMAALLPHDRAAVAEISGCLDGAISLCRPALRGKRLRRLLMRHARNTQPLAQLRPFAMAGESASLA